MGPRILKGRASLVWKRSGRGYRGFVAQEQFRLEDILHNRFGQFYAHGGTNQTSAELVAHGKTGHQRAGAAG